MVYWFRTRNSRAERPELTPEGMQALVMYRIQPLMFFRQTPDGRMVMTSRGFKEFQLAWMTLLSQGEPETHHGV